MTPRRLVGLFVLFPACFWIDKDAGSGDESGGSAGDDGGDSSSGGDEDGGGSGSGDSADTADSGVPCEVVELYRDADGDGYGTADDTVDDCEGVDGYVVETGDCDDADGSRHPGALEVCGDGLDQDCDEADVDCAWSGALDIADTAGMRIDGEMNDAAITTAMADVGDLDGDGASELVVGSGTPNGGAGRLWVVSGDPALATAGDVTTADVDRSTLSGVASTTFGVGAWGVGDLDGDGTDGFVVAQPLWPDATAREHSAFLWFDGPLPTSGSADDASAVFVLDEANFYSVIGAQAAGGIGWDDTPVLLLGVGDYRGFGSSDGRAWLVEDPASVPDPLMLEDEAAVVFTAANMTDGLPDDRQMGAGVQLCDLSGDGQAEVVVAAGSASGASAGADSALYVWFSEGPLPSRPTHADADVTLAGSSTYADMGNPTLCGDLDGDGRVELIFSGNQDRMWVHVTESATFSEPGAPAVSIDVSGLDSWRLPEADGRTGGQIAVVPNPFGDGKDHVVIADPYGGGASTGRLWLMDGRPDGSNHDADEDYVAVLYDTDNNNAGHRVTGLSDLDGDGYGDLAIGAGGGVPTDRQGRAWILFGGP